MCSRNGTPIEILDWPLPSRLISTRTSVSFVLRCTLATRLSLFIFISVRSTTCHFLPASLHKPENNLSTSDIHSHLERECHFSKGQRISSRDPQPILRP